MSSEEVGVEVSSLTDKQLLELIDKGHNASFDEFKKRYRPRIRSIYDKKFFGIKDDLRYSKASLYEDIEMEVWAKFYNIRAKKGLTFGTDDSIGGLIHKCASDLINEKVSRAISNRSHLSKDKRKALREEDEMNKVLQHSQGEKVEYEVKPRYYLTLRHGDFQVQKVPAYDDGSVDEYEFFEVPLDFIEKLKSVLTAEELRIVDLMCDGVKAGKIKSEMGLTESQYRTRKDKIFSKAEKLRAKSDWHIDSLA